MIRARLVGGVVLGVVAAGLAVLPADAEPSTPTRVGAARDHVERYAGSLGVTPGDLTLARVTRTVAGTDAVRFAQDVDGVPVIGGEVVVTVGSDRDVTSTQATVSRRSAAAEPLVPETDAARTALAVAARSARVPASRLTISSAGRWLLDPTVLGAPAALGTHTVWRFEVGDGAGVRRLVLVDVLTGEPVLNLDALNHLDRVVCDQQNVELAVVATCDTGFARTEASGPTGQADVDVAFELSGAVSGFYDEIGGLDLTDLLGVTVDGEKKLASTVRVCRTERPCPFPNAFWNGRGMYYGEGYAGADDVVGHEMTHGVIQRYSDLFNWGQSGSINESLADIMGEILDHRHAGPGDAPDDWRIGEDLPGGFARDLRDPTQGGDPTRADPDAMTSPFWVADLDYRDSGGIHSNSGVGNKTAYLISQGGRFHGQRVTGIDAGDPTLTKTATLYLLVIQTLASGSDYAHLADVLDQGCRDLASTGTAGFTSRDCVQVHRAGLATRLRTTPTVQPLPADAPDTCPTGTARRVLLDSEVGDPSEVFTAGPTWSRGRNATSGRDAWHSAGSTAPGAWPLVATQPVALPAGQRSYLWFQHWRRLDHDGDNAYDGGAVEVDGEDTAALRWVNGPADVLAADYDNPAGGRTAFGGDSRGYVVSRLDLTSYAGRSVTPQFTMYTDNEAEGSGWYVDDIRVYTCDPVLVSTERPSVRGPVRVGETLTARPGRWSLDGVTLRFRWLRDGDVVRGATGRTYRLRAADRGSRVAVEVTASAAGHAPVAARSKAVGPIR